jgi:diacylglycerol kinase (ATP)
VLHAGGYSLAGLKAGWHEKAFQQEAICAVVMIPLALWLGQSWEQAALLAGSVILVLIVELLNTGIEAAIDRIGPEWHELSKKAKDMGSAAVFLALCLCGAIWAAALYHRFIV